MDTLWVRGSTRAVVVLNSTNCTACPSSYHEFQGPEAIPYDAEGMHSLRLVTVDATSSHAAITGTDRGNRFKVCCYKDVYML